MTCTCKKTNVRNESIRQQTHTHTKRTIGEKQNEDRPTKKTKSITSDKDVQLNETHIKQSAQEDVKTTKEAIPYNANITISGAKNISSPGHNLMNDKEDDQNTSLRAILTQAFKKDQCASKDNELKPSLDVAFEKLSFMITDVVTLSSKLITEENVHSVFNKLTDLKEEIERNIKTESKYRIEKRVMKKQKRF